MNVALAFIMALALSAEPTVPGFGVDRKLPAVPTFEKAEPKFEKNNAQESKTRGMAQYVMRRFDKSGNGTLEKEEWAEMRGKYGLADTNKDGVITLKELADQMVSRVVKRKLTPKEPATELSRRKLYRFLTARERLADNLPRWFLTADANADGQVAMHEYARKWTDAKAQEFEQRDLNHDGVITQRECLRTSTKENPRETHLRRHRRHTE